MIKSFRTVPHAEVPGVTSITAALGIAYAVDSAKVQSRY
ncbi:hypothetical protein CFIICLFH_4655 [Methylobacterium goesingense]|uniref:Uncharacterized protein n=1 Tax=Methylobacterium goesingense TaxID=243690 RepID=A0ABV2L646_9HYPH|nr:hypothetical protein CFIICLFH_4655 [Methylobacterium goesingense]